MDEKKTRSKTNLHHFLRSNLYYVFEYCKMTGIFVLEQLPSLEAHYPVRKRRYFSFHIFFFHVNGTT